MIYFACGTLIGCTVGVYAMKIFDTFARKQKESGILSRKRCFKYTHKLYWAFKMEGGVTEFWAYSCINDEKWYLGKHDGTKIIECDGFYNKKLPWDVQHGGVRLFGDSYFYGWLEFVDTL